MPVEIARAKINLALHILGRRGDGYHELDSIVAFSEIGDRLSFEPAARLELAVDGPFAALVPSGEDNLAMRAARALGATVPPARIVLTKLLPVASGMGGGSADAAAVLRGLTRQSGKAADPAQLVPLARTLGADVPVCLFSRASRMTGIGECIEELLDFEPLFAVLANPKMPVATAAVFAQLGLSKGGSGFAPIRDSADLHLCRNDLEPPAVALAPQIAKVLQALRRQDGLTLARMSGSGATCFGLFASEEKARQAAVRLRAAHPHWWIEATVLR